MINVVRDLANERPDLLASSCVSAGGNNDFLHALLDRLRQTDNRWGYNWKRGNVGDMSQDVVDYYYGDGDPQEDSPDVFIIDVIGDHCGSPRPAFVTQAPSRRHHRPLDQPEPLLTTSRLFLLACRRGRRRLLLIVRGLVVLLRRVALLLVLVFGFRRFVAHRVTRVFAWTASLRAVGSACSPPLGSERRPRANPDRRHVMSVKREGHDAATAPT
jgi:hypothetical protein